MPARTAQRGLPGHVVADCKPSEEGEYACHFLGSMAVAGTQPREFPQEALESGMSEGRTMPFSEHCLQQSAGLRLGYVVTFDSRDSPER